MVGSYLKAKSPRSPLMLNSSRAPPLRGSSQSYWPTEQATKTLTHPTNDGEHEDDIPQPVEPLGRRRIVVH